MSEEQPTPETPDNVQSYDPVESGKALERYGLEPPEPPDRIQHEDLREHGTDGQLAELYAALAKAQGDFEEVRLNREGQEGHRKFRYADLAAIHRATRKHLAEHGLALTQFPSRRLGGSSLVRTVLAHSNGGRIISTIEYMPADKIQEEGKRITYMRRYATNAILGTAGDPDADELPDDSGGKERDQQPPPPPKQDKPKAKKQEPKKEPTPAKKDQGPPPAQQAKPESEEPAPDPEPEPSSEPQNSPDGPPTEDQQHAIRSLLVELQVGTSGAMSICKDVTGKGPRELTYADAGKLIEALQAKKRQG